MRIAALAVEAGPDRTVNEGDAVILSGSSNGTGAVSYRWAQEDPLVPVITFRDPASPSTLFAAPQVDKDTVFALSLTAVSGNLTGSDTISVTVRDTNPAPQVGPLAVEAGGDLALSEGETAVMSGAVTGGTGGPVSYGWTQESPSSPPISFHDRSSPSTAITAPQVDEDTFFLVTLTARQGGSATSDSMYVVVFDESPTPLPSFGVDAGPDVSVREGAQVALSGTVSGLAHDADREYRWAQAGPSSPVITFDNPALPSVSFTAPQVDRDTRFTLSLTVTVGTRSIQDTVVVTVRDSPVVTGSARASWTISDIAGALGSKGDHAHEIVVRCDYPGTTPTSAVVDARFRALPTVFGVNPAGGSTFSDVQIEVELSRNGALDVFENGALTKVGWGMATIYHDTDISRIGGTPGQGPTLGRWMDAAAGDTFAYPSGNYTKSHIGGWTAYSAGITWEGSGSCRTTLERITD